MTIHKSLPSYTVLLLLLFLTGMLAACDSNAPSLPAAPSNTATDTAPTPAPQPPAPPITEDFESQPRISFFPRIGAFRPETSDESYPYWTVFIEHVTKTSGVVTVSDAAHNRCWALRSVGDLDSVGYFAPLAVAPATRYRISAWIKTDLPSEASAGIGITEFRTFLWIGEQFTAEQMRQYALHTTEGARLTGNTDWKHVVYDFTTSPDTHMIHLILFRDGAKGRNPVLFDDISVTPFPPADS